VVLKENKHLRTAVRGYEYVVLRDSVALSAQDTVISATERRLTVAKVLGRDAENRAAQWRRKAKKRSWQNVALAALVVLITLVSVR
jgi:anti-sigma-K factor RskA